KKDIYLMHASYRDKVTDDMVAYLEDFHKKNPYRLGSRKAELRVKFLNKLKQNVFDEFMQRLEDAGRIKRSGEFICEGSYTIPHDEVYQKFESALTAMLDKAGFEFIKIADIQFPGIQPAMAEDLLQLLAAEGKVSIAMIRDMIGTSRKSAKPLLEYLDNIRVTRRNGTESERVAY
ncbi:MAG: SelB C-terminal domain-containing protein, partial [Eubacteriales bacterium]|nr:SelB C-terminal domain-containing protein [Eubacteriales bacterium]